MTPNAGKPPPAKSWGCCPPIVEIFGFKNLIKADPVRNEKFSNGAGIFKVFVINGG